MSSSWYMSVALSAAFTVAAFPAQEARAQTVTAVPATVKSEYGITSNWYQKYVDASGIPVLGSASVSDAALLKAKRNVDTLLRTYPYWPVNELRRQKVRVVIVARTEKMSSIPEFYARYGTTKDSVYWGGFGATASLPISSGTEANLLDNYGDENVFVHEFGHSVGEMALASIDPNYQTELTSAYNYARANGLWANTYAISNAKEYWAEGVQGYFGVNREGASATGDGVHNRINTRSELQGYDTRLYNLLQRVYRGITL